MTQFVRINYQYGFLDPILTLGNLEAECFDVSADGSLVAYVAGNILDIYSLHNGGRMQTLTRDVLASRVVFAQDGHELYFTAAGEDRKMESIQAETGGGRARPARAWPTAPWPSAKRECCSTSSPRERRKWATPPRRERRRSS